MARYWSCPNCDSWAITYDGKLPMHPCRGGGQLAGMMVPLVQDGTRAKVEAVVRPDYVGHELVQVNAHGQPVMAAVTTRDDGQDCTVFAPCATVERE